MRLLTSLCTSALLLPVHPKMLREAARTRDTVSTGHCTEAGPAFWMRTPSYPRMLSLQMPSVQKLAQRLLSHLALLGERSCRIACRLCSQAAWEHKSLVDVSQARADVVHVHENVLLPFRVSKYRRRLRRRSEWMWRASSFTHSLYLTHTVTIPGQLEQLMTKPPSALWLKECGRLAHISHSFHAGSDPQAGSDPACWSSRWDRIVSLLPSKRLATFIIVSPGREKI